MCHTVQTLVSTGAGVVQGLREWSRSAVEQDYPENVDLAHDVAVVVSELVSNAVEAGAVDLMVTATSHRTAMTVVVSDDAPGMPEMRTVAADSTSGRGLFIVAALSDLWGVSRTTRGKDVWAHVGVLPSSALAFACERDAPL